MFRILLIAVVASMLGFASGCGNGEGSSKKIALLLQTKGNPFFNEMADAVKAEAAKHGYEVVVFGGDNNADIQDRQIKDCIAKKFDALIVTPCNAQSVGASIKAANEAGIPVFTADTACLDKDAKIESHIATDNYSGGKLAGEAMIEALGGKGGNILILDYKQAESCLERVKGFKEVIDAHNKKNPASKIVVVGELASQAKEDPSEAKMKDALTVHKDLVGLFAINDPAALGAISAIEQAGRKKEIKIIGFDGNIRGKKAILAGDIYADPIQFPKEMGAKSILAIKAYFEGKRPEKVTLIPTKLYKKADAEKDPDLKKKK
jgi:ribose transport system substrate-binding protein